MLHPASINFTKEGDTTYNELVDQILGILPEATFGEDNEGQLVIYTNLKIKSRAEKDTQAGLDQELVEIP